MRWPGWSWLRGRGDDRPLGLLEREGFVALDLETTGLDPRRDVMVALAVVPFEDGEPGLGYETLVAPGRPIPVAAIEIHGISDAMVATAPPPGPVLEAAAAALGDATVVGHALEFDLTVLARARRAHGLPRLVNPTLCTRRLAGALYPRWADLSLEAVADHLGVPVVGRHTARGDAIIAGRVLLGLLPHLARRGARTIGEARWLQSRPP